MPPINDKVPDGHYQIIAYTGRFDAPRFLYNDPTVADRETVVAASGGHSTEWAIIWEKGEPEGKRIWRHPRLGHLLDHVPSRDTVIIWPRKDSGEANQTWDFEKWKEPTEEDADNYFWAIRSKLDEGYLTLGDEPLERDEYQYRHLCVKPAPLCDGNKPGENQRWLLLWAGT